MRYFSKYTAPFVLIAIAILLSNCNKQDAYLDVKRNNSDVAPATLADYQAILDNDLVLNTNYPMWGLASADNFYIPATVIPSLGAFGLAMYTWATDFYQGAQSSNEWTFTYQTIEYANIALDGLKKIDVTTDNQTAYDNIQGSAYFFRAFALYNLAQVYCKPYISGSASTDPGIPVRTSSNVNIKSTRGTVQQTYDQILADLKAARTLLPVTPIYKSRPSVPAVLGLLAKVYLCMEDYTKAKLYADSTLAINNVLMNFNNTTLVSTTSTVPFPSKPAQNPEIIFYALGSTGSYVIPLSSKNVVDTLLFQSYNSNDLRKTIFFKPNSNGYQFKGTYDGVSGSPFSGIATNELYLIRAECLARQNNTVDALSDLNMLLVNRWKTGTFIPLTASSPDSALVLILRERRKELPYTANLRWEDLRRLNKDSRFAITLTRIVNGTTYSLAPNDNKYVIPIPPIEIQLSGIEQNPR